MRYFDSSNIKREFLASHAHTLSPQNSFSVLLSELPHHWWQYSTFTVAIFGIVCELVQKLLTYCYKWLSSENANYLSSVIVGASVKCHHQCLRVILRNIILSSYL